MPKTFRQMNDRTRCLRCHYPLVGLKQAVCPECGLPFNPANPTTYTVEPHAAEKLVPGKWVVFILVFSLFGLLLWCVAFGLIL